MIYSTVKFVCAAFQNEWNNDDIEFTAVNLHNEQLKQVISWRNFISLLFGAFENKNG